jgi:hypothetical protein
VTVICEEGNSNLLMKYPFFGMQQDIEDVLYTKAKTAPVSKNPNFYEILHAYHIQKSKFTQAAKVMYEYAKRVENEEIGMEMLHKLGNILLACLNSLRRADPKHQWIISPKIKSEIISQHSEKNKKRVQEDNVILNIPTIQKEYMINKCRILLSKSSSVVITSNLIFFLTNGRQIE